MIWVWAGTRLPEALEKGVFEVTYETGFCATHQLVREGQPLEPLHGHDWRLEATVAGEDLDAAGLLLDFEELKRVLAEIVARYHYGDLNTHPDFRGQSPSAEIVARHIYHEARRLLGPRGAALARVRVHEAPGCSATYTAG